jgi:hypothetical protein
MWLLGHDAVADGLAEKRQIATQKIGGQKSNFPDLHRFLPVQRDIGRDDSTGGRVIPYFVPSRTSGLIWK